MPPRYFDVDDIPIEQGDLLEDAHRLFDVHRVSRFGLRPFVQPVTEIRRQDDLYVVSFTNLQNAVAATRSVVALSNTTTDRNLRPLLVWWHAPVGGTAQELTCTTNPSPALTPTSTNNPSNMDTRKPVVAGANNGQFITATPAGFMGGNTIGQFALQVLIDTFLPPDTCRQIVLAPGAVLAFQNLQPNTALLVGAVWQVEPIRRSRFSPLGTGNP